jgi:hypothetical protein
MFILGPSLLSTLCIAWRISMGMSIYMLHRYNLDTVNFFLNGRQINVLFLFSQNTISKFKQQLLYELFGLKDNRGSLPSVYVETIDD